jgi:phage terminase large subunit-like protein
MRMHAQTATIENGFVHLRQEAPWLGEYLHELAVFPYSRFDEGAGYAPRPVFRMGSRHTATAFLW